MLSDLKSAFRQLARSPGFTAVCLLTLALGIGANTAIFSVIDSIFLRPLPYTHPEQLVHLTSSLPAQNLRGASFSYPRLVAIRDAQQVFSDISLGTFNDFTVTGHGDSEQLQGFEAAANYLSVLGIQPLLGRNFNASEDRPGGASVVLLGHAYWQRHYNADSSALGQQITLNGKPHTIIGVLPPALSEFPFERISLWTPRPAETSSLVPAQLNNGSFAFEVIARLKPDITLSQAQEQINVLAESYRTTNPKNIDAPSDARVNLLLDDLVGHQRQSYVILFGAVVCVLIIASANVANLFLARFVSRRKEIALRFALGASRARVVRQLLVESLLVALIGAALGLLFAQWGLGAFVHLGQNFVTRSQELSISPTSIGFTLFVTLLTGFGIGFFPAMHAAQRDVSQVLNESSRGSSSRVQGRLRSCLLIGEIALSLVLLIAAGLLLNSFARLQHVPLGFQPQPVFVSSLTLSPEKYSSRNQLAALYVRLLERLASVPGIKSVALNDAPPLSGNNARTPIAVLGRTLPSLSERPLVKRHLISPGMFGTLGIALKSGRDFTARDNLDSPQTVIINETMARLLFPGQNPIGEKLITGMVQVTAEIVGVVSDTRSANLNAPAAPEYFLPLLQRPENSTWLLVRTEVDPSAIAGSVRAAISEIDPDLPLSNSQTMTVMIARSVADRRLVMMVLAAFASLALVLASLGVYSVMAYLVGQRTHEIGIRMALGADPAQVQTMVFGQGMKFVGVGITLGLATAFSFSRFLEKILFEVKGTDPATYVSLAFLVSIIAALACYIPARRATKVDPLLALRAE